MLERYLKILCEELSISKVPEMGPDRVVSFQFNETLLTKFQDLSPGISIQAEIFPCPEDKKEDLFIWMMRANLLGQGAGGCRIGLSSDEKTLTLSLGLPYEMDYKSFKLRYENFVNYVFYFRNEIEKYVREGTYPQ